MAASALVLALGGVMGLPAQDAEDIFGEEESVVDTTEATQAAAPTLDLLKTEGARLTGRLSASADVSATWDALGTGTFDLLDPRDRGLTPGLSLNLGFSAKPDADLGFYGEIRTSYPFVKSAEVFVPNPAFPDDPTQATAATFTVPDVTVFTLSTRFNWSDLLFFAFGKQPVRWGTGYFFTPADDILSLAQVDLEDPTAEREGPLALKVQFPIPGTLSNLYLFAVAPTGAERLVDVALAPKMEIQFGNTELALAGYYQRDSRPQIVAMGSTGFSGLNLFGEAQVGFGTDRVYVVVRDGEYTAPLDTTYVSMYRTEAGPETPIFTGTLGASYQVSSWNMSIFAQYLYNGQGYVNLTLGDLLAAFGERLHPLYPDADDPALGLSDIGLGSRVGRHYAAATVSWTELFGSDFGFSVLALANLSDLSGFVKPTLSLQLFPRLSMTAGATLTFGEDGDELTDPAGSAKKLPGSPTYEPDYVAKPTMTLSLGLSFGSGGF
jgi:hypothetical protein